MRLDALVLLGAGAMSIDARIEAAINAALGQSGDADLALHHAQDRGASAPVHQIAIASAITAVATIAGLWFVSLLPRPSMVAASAEYIQADQAERQAIEERFEGLVDRNTRLLRNLAFEERRRRGRSVACWGEGVKSFPTLPEGDRTHAGAKAFGLIPPEGER